MALDNRSSPGPRNQADDDESIRLIPILGVSRDERQPSLHSPLVGLSLAYQRGGVSQGVLPTLTP